jgi:L-asparaginase/Glu-tRNA(Gln) amidotransferase subunit D
MNRQQRRLEQKQIKKTIKAISGIMANNLKVNTPTLMKSLNVSDDMLDDYKKHINKQIENQGLDGM